ncbi:intraflagellar transport protein 140 homolog [Cloeon dipterum]|uniref:intraflagellar transport protein 140 homolog n=1 Tax=Cloeon dipterum TaxID=197152 RepID=UPI00321FF048
MALYFNYKVDVFPHNVIHVNAALHSQHKILAVASHSEDKGGTVTLCNDEGELVKGVSSHAQLSGQAVSLAWHPAEKTLAVGWEHGVLSMWLEERLQFVEADSPHKAPVGILQWSSRGSRLVSGDAVGMVVAWRADSKGILQPIFQTDLKEPLTCCTFKVENSKLDINGLAKAAVAGDELALDLFSSWRPKTASSRFASKSAAEEGVGFFVGSISGAIYHFDEDGVVTEVCNEKSPINKILYHASKNQLVVLTDSLVLAHFSIQPEGQLVEISRLKLSGRSQGAILVWSGPNTIAVSTRELSVRCLDLDTNDNYLLTLENPSDREHFICLDYNANRGILCGGTNLGRVAIWKYSPAPDLDPEAAWKLQMPNKLTGGAIQHILWGVGGSLLVVHTVKEIFLLREQQICAEFSPEMSTAQVAPNQLTVWHGSEGPMELCCDTQIKGIALDSQQVVVWGTKRITVYELSQKHFKVVGSFACECVGAKVYEHSLYCIEGSSIQVRTNQGTIKQNLTFASDEGEPIGIEICGSFLTVATLLGWVKVWDLSRREAKLHTNPKYLNDVIHDFGEIILARSNCEGSKVSITVARSNLLPDCKLYLWSTDTDTLQAFDFSTQEATLADRFVLNHVWDIEEPKLLVCEAKVQPKLKDQRGKRKIVGTTSAAAPDKQEVMLVTMFATADGRFLIQNTDVLLEPYCRLIGSFAPHYILLKKPSGLEKDSDSGLVARVLMQDFEGLGDCDKTTKNAILNFSYYLTIGNMDEAFKAIRAIKIATVWESMAKMCVKTKRLDVALVCLGHMKHARGAIELKKAISKEAELDAQVAVLAMQLGLNDEAEKLLKNCGRYDLLNKFYQDTEQWDKAIQVAETQNRIHLRTTYYNYAKHLEFIGDLNSAVKMYEKSETHRFEVPRMLMEDQNLEFYMTNNKDPHLMKWWAQYLESNGELEGALEYYEKAGDTMSLVRVNCFREKFEKAISIASDSEDKAACYHLARQLENANKAEKAIEFFCKAHAYGNAIRLCKEQGMNEQIWSLALKANPQDQLEAAQYFEQQQMPERAVRLFHKAGMLHKAVDLAFQFQQYSALQSIILDLDSSSDPKLLKKCAKFFVDNKQYERAVEMLAIAKQYESAIELCVQNNVPITEELAERLTIEKDENNEASRVQVLLAVAESAHIQGNYHLAAKKYTQAGDKIQAMKSLLKSGDTEKIVYYTNVSKQREIYVMAANYLQSLDWRNSPEIMKHIIAFYSKGKALDLLAEFYVACAQVEVDEFRDYEKALGAYVEASRCIARGMASNRASEGVSVDDQKRRGHELAKRLDLIKKYVEIKRLFERESESAQNLSRELLQVPQVEATVRKGDVYALMISHYLKGKNLNAAVKVLEEMKSAGINPTYYLDTEMLRALGVPGQSQTSGILEQAEDEIEEHVDEDDSIGADL